MRQYPSDAEAQLGFALIRQRLAEHAISVLGRERVEALAATADRPSVERLLAQTEELQRILRTDSSLPLQSIPDVRQSLRRAQPKDATLEGEELAEVGVLLASMRRTEGYFRTRREAYPSVSELALEMKVPNELEQHIIRVIDPRGRVKDDASPELARLSRRIAEAQDHLRSALMKALRAAAREGYAAEDQPTIRGGRAVIPVRAEAKRKVEGFVHDVSGTGQTVYIEPTAVLDLNNEVRELELERAREIRRLLQALTQHLRAKLAEVRIGVDVLARLDELQARARLGNELDALVPALNEEGHLRIVRGRNPALSLHFLEEGRAAGAGSDSRKVVPLDLELSDETRTLVVTGPNAGGKSVAMKTAGLMALMAAYGLPVPAAPGTTLPLFEHLFVDIGDQQSIEHDLSTFTSHLANLRTMLATAGARSLVLIDEAGTGTDPSEGGALAQAVLEALTDRGARTVATTHHGTLKAFAHDTPHVENASMQFDQGTLTPTYVFQSGIPGSSYAFEIAQRVGLDQDVLERARVLVGDKKSALEDLIATFEARTRDLEEQLDAARAEVRRAEQIRKSFEGRDRALRDRKAELLEAAAAEAQRLVEEANARVERTIREIKEAQAEKETTRQARDRLDAFKEEVAQKKRKSRRPRTAPAVEPPKERHDASGPIAIGDQVRLDGNEGVGEVLELGDREAVVALGPMRVRAALDRLTKVGKRPPQRVEVRAPRGAGAVPGLTAHRRIDVRGQRVDEVIPAVERLIDQALVAELTVVEILHGTGTGALRHAIREYLDARPETSDVADAPWDEGGPGVTVVRLD